MEGQPIAGLLRRMLERPRTPSIPEGATVLYGGYAYIPQEVT
jgi:hypothetical protein